MIKKAPVPSHESNLHKSNILQRAADNKNNSAGYFLRSKVGDIEDTRFRVILNNKLKTYNTCALKIQHFWRRYLHLRKAKIESVLRKGRIVEPKDSYEGQEVEPICLKSDREGEDPMHCSNVNLTHTSNFLRSRGPSSKKVLPGVVPSRPEASNEPL